MRVSGSIPEGCDWAKAALKLTTAIFPALPLSGGLGHRHQKDLVDVRSMGLSSARNTSLLPPIPAPQSG